MNLRSSRAALGLLLAVWVGWLWLAAVWMPERLIVLPQPTRLIRHIVSMFIG